MTDDSINAPEADGGWRLEPMAAFNTRRSGAGLESGWCKACGGAGSINGSACVACGGSGLG